MVSDVMQETVSFHSETGGLTLCVGGAIGLAALALVFLWLINSIILPRIHEPKISARLVSPHAVDLDAAHIKSVKGKW